MQPQNVKSATTAGLLGIFLGSFGAHNFYLGEKSKGIIHVCMMSAGLLVEILATAILPNVLSLSMLLQMAWIFTMLAGIASLVMFASAIWGLSEGVTILTQGDAGLARKGYAVAQPQMMNQNYGYPQNPNQPPMNNNFGQVPQSNPDQNNNQINQGNMSNGQ